MAGNHDAASRTLAQPLHVRLRFRGLHHAVRGEEDARLRITAEQARSMLIIADHFNAAARQQRIRQQLAGARAQPRGLLSELLQRLQQLRLNPQRHRREALAHQHQQQVPACCENLRAGRIELLELIRLLLRISAVGGIDNRTVQTEEMDDV
ncbi:hypothetical protein [Paenibacillus aestuarii]|uniref:Uncharacterized protein n=1 Tax=Paenibacillus aestuarii TaxID=516965 RepID=A0ABW0KFJ2_9BACL|nr:hypothetical protein [Paenibacillus aestuarii]